MKLALYIIIGIIAVFGIIGLHAYFLNQAVCGADAKNYNSFYDLDNAHQWIVNTGSCSVAQPVTITVGSTQHDILTQPFWLAKVWYIVLQLISKLYLVVLG